MSDFLSVVSMQVQYDAVTKMSQIYTYNYTYNIDDRSLLLNGADLWKKLRPYIPNGYIIHLIIFMTSELGCFLTPSLFLDPCPLYQIIVCL